MIMVIDTLMMMMMMSTDDTGVISYDRSDMSHVLDRITDRKVGGIDALSMGTLMMPCIS